MGGNRPERTGKERTRILCGVSNPVDSMGVSVPSGMPSWEVAPV